MYDTLSEVRQGATQARVALFNVKFSPNLGDGLIAEQIEAALAGPDRAIAVRSLDLAGRAAWGDVATRNRRAKLAVLGSLPPGVRRKVTRLGLKRSLDAQSDAWRAAIGAADHVVIGGGHLFQDDSLNFPLKVGTVLDLCREAGSLVSIHAVGVSRDWSDQARALFGRLADCRIGTISVRDARSARNWARHFAGTAIADAAVVPDPALAIPALDGAPRPEGSARVGLAIADPTLLAHHGHGAAGQLLAFFARTAAQLAAEGHAVTLFTNGATEDEAALRRVMEAPELLDHIAAGRIARAADPAQPDDLIACQSGFDCVVAHRLHANILAYALGRPPVGLGWDRKVQSFFDLIQRPGAFLPKDRLDADAVVDMVRRALAEGLDPAIRRRVTDAARQSLTDLRRAILETRPV